MASNLRRTDDLQRIKTRELILQNTNGTYPTLGSIAYIGTGVGNVSLSPAAVDGAGNVIAPGTLSVANGKFTVDGDGDVAAAGALTAATGQFSVTNTADVSIAGNLAIGLGSAVHTLDVNGQVYIGGSGPATQIFTTPGRYTIRIPQGAGTATITVVGAGGGGAAGGYGGYIQGTFDTTTYAGQTLTIQVGSVGVPTVPIIYDRPSQASFASFMSGGPIMAMAGAGGCQADNAGGHGGGGVFTAVTGGSVATGTNGAASGTAGGGQGGQLAAGGSGGVAVGTGSINGPNGSGRPSSETYADVSGGFGFTTSAGGNGYTSGGAGGIVESTYTAGAGGGGSSYVNSAFTIATSLRGDSPSYNATVPAGYGRSGQNGYVSITYSMQPSLSTSGDIVSGKGLRISSPSVPASAIAAGNPGQIAWDNGYMYVCVAPNTWKRAAINTW